jgi:hypothetical protein
LHVSIHLKFALNQLMQASNELMRPLIDLMPVSIS